MQLAALRKSRKGDIMGTYYSVQEHELKIIDAPAAIAMLRVAIQQQIDADIDRPNYYSEAEWSTYRANQNARWQAWLALPDAELLSAVAEDVRWSTCISDDGEIVAEPPSDEVKGGIDYGWLDMIAPFVTGYIQVFDKADIRTYRVVWRDGKRGRYVAPVWPEPSDDEENEAFLIVEEE